MTQDGYGQAYQRGFCKTVGLLRSRGASIDHAEDVAQAAWMQGWKKLEQLKDDGMVVSWVNTIAINCHRRAGQRNRDSRHCPIFAVMLVSTQLLLMPRRFSTPVRLATVCCSSSNSMA